MRFFTLDAYNNDMFDFDAAKVVLDRYSRHLQEMEGVLPDELLALARLDGVDDGLIVSVRRNRRRKTLDLTMRCGNLIIGYYDLEITYSGASLLPDHYRTMNYIVRNQTLEAMGRYLTAGDLAYHEVDRADNGRCEHRLLFHPGRWFAIQFAAIRWRQIPRPNRRIRHRCDRYPSRL